MKEKKKVLFVCVNNSARSQMAEGLLRHLHGDVYEVFSAGAEPTTLNPLAREAMAEIGIDISGQRSKGLDEFKDVRFDLAVTVCGPGASCPFVPNAAATVHQEFDDPAKSADMDAFRRIRDEICVWVRDAFKDPDHLPAMPQMPVGLL
jgi:arsenate reductase (thioredoxin)